MRDKQNRTYHQLIIRSDLNETQRVEKFTEKLAESMHFSDEQKDGLAIAITEIVNNAITHGNRNDLRRKVIIDYELTSDAMIITIQDEGRGFAPEKVADPLAPENLLKESGRGIFIVRTLMDSVNYEFNESGTLVRMVKQKHQE